MELFGEFISALMKYGAGAIFLAMVVVLWRQYVSEIREWRKQYVQLIVQYEKLLTKVTDVFATLNARLESHLKDD